MGLLNKIKKMLQTKSVIATHEERPQSLRYVPMVPSIPNAWRDNEINWVLLARFLKPRKADSIPDFWAPVLGSMPDNLIAFFLKEGILIRSDLIRTMDFFNTVPELKALLKDRDLKVSGKKEDLINRLVLADENGMQRLHSSKVVIQCSDAIRPDVLSYLEDKQQEFEDLVIKLRAALSSRNFSLASKVTAAYESKQKDISIPNPVAIPSPPRVTVDDIETLDWIFTLRPKILRGLLDSEWEPLLNVSALIYLLGGRSSPEWLPEGFVGVTKFDNSVTVRMVQSHIRQQLDLKKYKRLGLKTGSVLFTGAGCEECQAISGKVMKLEKIPELPYEKCTCKMGCRCLITPEISPELFD